MRETCFFLAFVLKNIRVHFDSCPPGVAPVPPYCIDSGGQGCPGLLGQSWPQLAVPGANIPRGEGQCLCVHMETQLTQLSSTLLAGTSCALYKWS